MADDREHVEFTEDVNNPGYWRPNRTVTVGNGDTLTLRYTMVDGTVGVTADGTIERVAGPRFTSC